MDNVQQTNDSFSGESLGEKLFRLRDYTPIPLLILMFFVAHPTVVSATLGLFFIFAGELLRVYSVAFIGSISRTRSGSLGEKLVVAGPFRYVRNPLYIANFFIVLGVSFFAASFWLFLLTVVLFVWQYYWIVQYEEGLLEKKFGEDFQHYREEVPAWLPKKAPSLYELDWPQSFSPAIYSERRTLLAIVIVIVLLLLRA